MKHSDVPPFLMWCGPLLFAFGMAWIYLATAAAETVTTLDVPARSALLIGAGMLGTVLGQLGISWAWWCFVRETSEDKGERAVRSAGSVGTLSDTEQSHEAATRRTREPE